MISNAETRNTIATQQARIDAVELQTEAFLRDVEPTDAPRSPFCFDYEDALNCECHCTLQIDGDIVICTVDDADITDMTEHLITRVCHAYGIDPFMLVWLEHYLPADKWTIVDFDVDEDAQRNLCCVTPKWGPTDSETVEAIRKRLSR